MRNKFVTVVATSVTVAWFVTVVATPVKLTVKLSGDDEEVGT